MAQRRMFNKTITNNDNFLEMPDSSQNLYFHLSMNADDDGFVDNWKSIIRMTGHKEDDLKIYFIDVGQADSILLEQTGKFSSTYFSIILLDILNSSLKSSRILIALSLSFSNKIK